MASLLRPGGRARRWCWWPAASPESGRVPALRGPLGVQWGKGQLGGRLEPVIWAPDGASSLHEVESVGLARVVREVLLALVNHFSVDQDEGPSQHWCGHKEAVIPGWLRPEEAGARRRASRGPDHPSRHSTCVGPRDEPEAAVLQRGVFQGNPQAQHPTQGLRVQEGGVLVRGDCSRPAWA